MTAARYRLVYYVSPQSGLRMPIAALLATEQGASVLEGEHLPGPACLGGVEAANNLHFILRALREADNLEELPAAVGPQADVSALRTVPRDVVDPVRWIKANLLLRLPATEGGSDTFRMPTRAAHGRRFLERWSVARYVRSNFGPEVAKRYLPSLMHRSLPSITHWVMGAENVLLLEPLSADRRDVAADIREVGARFYAYRGAMASTTASKKTSLVAYLTAGVDEHLGRRMLAELSGPADETVDTSDAAQAAYLVGRIRDTGESALHAPGLWGRSDE